MKIATHERADTIANGDNIKCGPYDDVGHRQAWQACSQLRIDCEEAWPSREKGRLLLETVAGRLRLLLRNSRTGGLEVYDINNNQITGAALIGTVGLDWQFADIGPVHGAGESDLVLRNKNTGAFEVYDIANNQLTGAAPLGAVGLDWQLGGFAVDPPTVSGTFTDMSNDQLVQAMAGFGGGSGAAESLNTVALGADTSQQTLLTAPQHV